ncbi:MAG TPA: hypothetical protein VJ741_05735 [Solirubrobacteraceae bacterium]|nr:hypothetical protein [Solirubrobacteraceae bacterium]
MAEVPSNQDMLDWFDEDERKNCLYCRERACVGLPEASAQFCFACGAVTVAGMRLDVNREIRV